MMIITADDFGKTRHATDSILKCFLNKRISSTSAMVFMEDSERAADLSSATSMEVGLHLNFTMPFSAAKKSPKLCEHHNRIVSYLTKNNLAQVIYNPFLIKSFNFLFLAQEEEFIRLYERKPEFYNGHHHMHLCANILLSNMIPKDARVRRTFTFDQGEKNLFRRFYRNILDMFINRMFISTDSFFSILPLQNHERHRNIFDRAVNSNVEIEVHPENNEEIEFLLSDKYQHMISAAYIGCFRNL